MRWGELPREGMCCNYLFLVNYNPFILIDLVDIFETKKIIKINYFYIGLEEYTLIRSTCVLIGSSPVHNTMMDGGTYWDFHTINIKSKYVTYQN